jgi:CheY-like chemotaxis protein
VTKRIAVVDDEQDFLLLMKTLLSEQGYEVGTCSNGTEAFQFIKDLQPSLVFLDLRMSNVSGWDILKELKNDPATREIKVIVTSAATDEINAAEPELTSWRCDVLIKPFDIDEALRKTRQCLAISL